MGCTTRATTIAPMDRDASTEATALATTATTATSRRDDDAIVGAMRARVAWIASGASLIAQAGELRVRTEPAAPASLSVAKGDASATLRAIDARRESTPAIEEGASRVRWRDVYPDTDAVAFASAGLAELTYVLRSPRAPTQFSFEIDSSPEWVVGDDAEGKPVLRDHKGGVVLRVTPFVVLDAKGARRALTARREGHRLDVTIDTAGLEYPLTLDPGFETATWVTSTLTTGPSPRLGHGVIYDTARNVTVVFAGCTFSTSFSGQLSCPADTWEWNGATWTKRTDAPFPFNDGRGFQMGTAWDSGRGVIVAFGGGYGQVVDNNLYEYDGKAWTVRAENSGSIPGIRALAAMAYDVEHAVTLMFGGSCFSGCAANILNDFWAWDGSNWTNLVADGAATMGDAGTSVPSRRRAAAMGYDPKRKVTVLFGGEESAGAGTISNDTWEWNGATWREVTPTLSPPPLAGAMMTWDAALERLVMVGGNTAQTFVYDGTTWTSLTSSGMSRRTQSGFAYDVQHKTMNVFGGNSNATLSSSVTVSSGGVGDLIGATPMGDLVQWAEAGCTNDSECGGGSCVGGYCCDKTCGGSCQTCAPVGTCTTVKGGVASPDPSCHYLCDGTATACPTACTDSSTCAPGATCTGGVCVPLAPLGTTCTTGSACASGLCIDSVCCNNNCTGQCEMCNVATSPGTCTFVSGGGAHGGRPACSSGTGTCAGTCNGTSATCAFPTATTSCAAPACLTGSVKSPAGICNGAGACASQAPIDCAPYACASNDCKSSCASAADCSAGSTCSIGEIGVGVCVSGSASTPPGGLETATWVTSSATPAPTARLGQGMVYDTTRDVTVLFGGCTFNTSFSGQLQCSNDTWEWNGVAWTQRKDAPLPFGISDAHAFQMGAVWDRGRGVVVSFGGGLAQTVFSTLLEYNGKAWTNRAEGTPAPPARALPSMAYDVARAVTVMFGGSCFSGCTNLYNDLWTWDGTNWVQLIADGATADAGGFNTPSRRRAAAMGYDEKRNVTVLYGGSANASGASALGDTWEWNGASWTQASPAQSPPPLAGAQLAWDARQERLVMVGGNTSQTYAYDGKTWTPQSATGMTPRTQFGFAYDVARKTMNVFGGNTTASLSNTASVAGGSVGDLVSTTAAGDFLQWVESPCTASSQCGSGACVGGFCCDTSCAGSCQTCAPAGICTTVAKGIASPDPSCPYVCDGASTTCPTAKCSSDASCGPGAHCVSGACVPLAPLGAACTSASLCASGLCIDGTCCNTNCAGQCEACDNPTSLGTCTFVVGAPHLPRALCGGSGSCAGTCGGASTSCVFPNSGTTCSSAACAGVSVSPAGVCDGNGVCDTVAPVSCAPYGCTAGVCNSHCSSSTDCAPGSYCAVGDGGVGVCFGTKPQGGPCGAGDECTTGFCVDGVCCNAACTGACHACSNPGSIGTCAAVDGVKDPRGHCASNECAVDVCKAGACSFQDATVPCGVGCTDGVLTSGHCSGTDATCAATTSACAFGLACADATTCKVRCAVDTDCVVGLGCDVVSGECVPPVVDAGTDVAIDTFVAPDVADVADVPDVVTAADVPDVTVLPDQGGPAPADIPTDGAVPTVPNTFQRCTLPSECASGFCVDGVCCNNACDDPCHSCALIGSPGVCAIEPQGVDLRNNCGLAGTCIGTCNGGGQCTGAGPATLCARNRCTGQSTGVGAAFCTAAGADCPIDSQVTFACTPYVCDGAFGACKTTCIDSNDCASGFVCDGSSKSCVTAPTTTTSGGCSVGRAGNHGLGEALFAALFVAGARRRRRVAAGRRQ
ncbi:MAG: hypothetical protein ACHREM_14005 [Polyangiales bacterium]